MTPDRNDIRKEVRLNGQDTIDLMRMSAELGISECDVIRIALRQLRKNFIKVGLIDDTGRLPD